MSDERPDVVAKATAPLSGSPRRVFDVFVDDSHFFALRPGAVEHDEVTPLPSGGHSCTQVYETNGRRLTQRCRALEWVPGERVVSEAEGDSGRHVETIELVPTAGGTQIRVTEQIFLVRRRNWLVRRALKAQSGKQIRAFIARLDELASD